MSNRLPTAFVSAANSLQSWHENQPGRQIGTVRTTEQRRADFAVRAEYRRAYKAAFADPWSPSMAASLPIFGSDAWASAA